ncbi:MAG TPA: DUF5655 domain-containing protein [Candidatus Limnocylindrales bacterium]
MRANEMVAGIFRNLPARTGRTGDEWLEIIRRDGSGTHRQRVEWLKRDHGLGHSTASILVRLADDPTALDVPEEGDTSALDALYAGPKAGLRPVYDRIAEAVRALGPDVTVEPRQTYVSFQRGRQFGIVQASTKSRIDLGLRLPGVAPAGRLAEAGSFGSGNVTHRVGLASTADVDDELLGWLRAAYLARG